MVLVLLVVCGQAANGGDEDRALRAQPASSGAAGVEPMHCVAFSPYVGRYDPSLGPHPPGKVIRRPLNALVEQTPFRCIMTYGVLNGLDHVFPAAQARGLKVIAIVWLDTDPAVNEQSIERGIAAAKAYPNTIVRISCGSEVRTRHGRALDNAILDCIRRFRAAGVAQPLTSIDTWWEWCAQSMVAGRCDVSDRSGQVDWIGINVFPWWENKFSGIYPCTPAAEAAAFHVARMREVVAAYPGKEVILTEFGWPAGPAGFSETNLFTGQRCGVASERNQRRVIRATLKRFHRRGWSAVVFEAFREPWKRIEGPVGRYWGICKGFRRIRCEDLRL